MKNVSPCSTRSRNKGHWLLQKNRRTSIREMMRLQGIDPDEFKQVVPDSVIRQQIGNAMSVNVVERIRANALRAAGLTQKSCLKSSDQQFSRWESGIGFDSIRPTASKATIPKTMSCKDEETQRTRNEMYLMSTGSARKIMLDRGASHHMVNIDDLTDEELEARRELDISISLRSATHVIWVKECVDTCIYELAITVVADLTAINGCPCVLSFGK